MRTNLRAVVTAVGLVTCGTLLRGAETPGDGLTLSDAQHEFYNARYDTAAAQTLELRTLDPEDLAAHELRASALLFQLKNALGASRDKQKDFRVCAPCSQWMKAFLEDTASGQVLARRRLSLDPQDESALFFLGKLDLNYVWLQLGTLGRKTGWDEYGRRDGRSTPCSKPTPDMYEVVSRVPGSTTSWIPGCRRGRAGSWGAAAGSER